MTQTRSSKQKWLALLAVAGAFTYTFLSRYIWSPLMKDASAEFGLSSAQSGLFMSAFFLGYVIMQLPGGILADRFSPRLILAAGTAIGGICTGMVAFVPTFATGAAFRLVAGLASGVIFSCSTKVLSYAFKAEERGIALGILMASPPLGITLASLIGPVLKSSIGWRQTFLVIGFLAVPIVLLLFFAKTGKGQPAAAQPERPSFLLGFAEYIKNKNQLLIAAGGFMFMLTTTGFPTWVNGFTGALNFSAVETTTIAMGYSISGIVGSILSGMLANKLKMNNRSFLILTLVFMAGLSLAIAFKWSFVLFAALSIVYGFVSYLPASHFAAIVINNARPEFSATSVALFNLFQQSASVIQPVLLGSIIDGTGGYNVIWYIFSASMAVSVITTTLTSKKIQMQENAAK